MKFPTDAALLVVVCFPSENVTITSGSSKQLKNGRRKSQEFVPNRSYQSNHPADNPYLNIIRHTLRDLEFLATSTHITELSYGISDIQARIFGAFRVLGSHPFSYLIDLSSSIRLM